MKAQKITNPNLNKEVSEQIWCSVELNNESILVGCVYRPPNSTHETNTEINDSINAASQLGRNKNYNNLIIVGDFNYGSIEWADCYCPIDLSNNNDCEAFVETIQDNFLKQMISESTFSHSSENDGKILDLILTNDENRIQQIKHEPNLGLNERGHDVLTWSFLLKNELVTKPIKEFKCYRKGDYKRMNDYFTKIDWNNRFKNKNMNECYNLFLAEYNQASENFIPKFSINRSKINKPKWINNEIRSKTKIRNNLWHANKKYKWRNKNLRKNYDKMNKELETEIENAQTNYEKEIIKDIKHNPKKLFGYIKSKQNVKSHINEIKISSGKILTDQKHIVDELNAYFSSVFTQDNEESVPEFPNKCQTKSNKIKIEEKTLLEKLLALDVINQ